MENYTMHVVRFAARSSWCRDLRESLEIMDGFYGQPAYAPSSNDPVKQHPRCTSEERQLGGPSNCPISSMESVLQFRATRLTQLGCNGMPRCWAAMACSKRTGAGTSHVRRPSTNLRTSPATNTTLDTRKH